MADDFRHGVATDIGVVEHEGVAGVVAHGLDARNQLVIDDARGAVLELAHPFIDQRDQIDQAVGHRRVDGVAARPGVHALEPEPVGVLVLGIDALRHWNDFGEDVELFGHARAAAEQHVDDFLEIEQPERQFQVARVEHQRAVAEAAAILVVNVEQENPQVRPCLQNLVEQQRHAGRFADAGGAEHGEVLGEHLLDVDIGDHRAVLLQGADIDLVRPARRIDRAKILCGNEVDGIADRRIIGDAALEFGAFAARNFAEQIDRRTRDVVVGGRRILARYLGDHRDDGGIGAADTDEAADGGAHFGDGHLARRQKSDPGEGAAHGNHTSEGCHGVGSHELGSDPHYGQPRLAKRLNRRGFGSAKSAASRSGLVFAAEPHQRRRVSVAPENKGFLAFPAACDAGFGLIIRLPTRTRAAALRACLGNLRCRIADWRQHVCKVTDC